MSFFGKFKSAASASSPAAVATPVKKDVHAPQPTPLERHLKDVTGPVRADGSDKYFGFENYGSTCYCNSIIQCLFHSAPFRSHVLDFPALDYRKGIPQTDGEGAELPPRSTSQIAYPNAMSPARKEPVAPGSPGAKPEETKDSPEYRKRMALKAGPVLDMVHDRSNRYGMDESLFTALKDIFDAVTGNRSRIGVVSPHKFLEILRRENEMFRSAMHQDAHEFLNLLLNQVIDSVEAFSKQHPAPGGAPNGAVVAPAPAHNGTDTHWVHDQFEGLLTSETRCLTCENTSRRDEPFLDLSVDLSAHTSVTSCLRKFSEEEMLCERNKFHCDNCGGLQEAEKRMKIKRLPRILALHLKRFKYTEDLQRLQKLFHRVVYPFYLRLFNTTDDAEDPDRLYELYAVVVHIGGGPYHGHYVSIIKTQDRGWLLFDDELVEPVDKSFVLNFFGGEPVPGVQDAKQLACAYVLFYQETTLDAMLREQEMEGRQPAPAAAAATATAGGRTSDVETTRDPISPISGKNIPHQAVAAPTLVTPVDSREAGPRADFLTHVKSAPAASPTSPSRGPIASEQPLSPSLLPPVTVAVADTTTALPSPPAAVPTTDASEPPLDKKSAKAAAKAAKAAAKVQQKELEEKRRQASARRIEAWKKQDEEVKKVIEESRQTAREEEERRKHGEDGGGGGGGGTDAGAGGGLSRLRHGSMSLRGKPKWIGGIKDKDKDRDRQATAPAPAPVQGVSMGADGTPLEEDDVVAEKMGASAGVSERERERERERDEGKKSVRSRFSLGRKRSQAL